MQMSLFDKPQQKY